LDGERLPWLVSDPIYIDLPAPGPEPEDRALPVADIPNNAWRTEHDPSSFANLTVGDQVTLDYRIGVDAPHAYVAVATDLPHPAATFDAVIVDVSASQPARGWVQFRSADGLARWRKSFHVGTRSRPIVLRTAGFTGVDAGQHRPFAASEVTSVLLVFDLVNSSPGSANQVTVHRIALGR
jgi:hypothetical protein